jgi:hypothetical protein
VHLTTTTTLARATCPMVTIRPGPRGGGGWVCAHAHRVVPKADTLRVTLLIEVRLLTRLSSGWVINMPTWAYPQSPPQRVDVLETDTAAKPVGVPETTGRSIYIAFA